MAIDKFLIEAIPFTGQKAADNEQTLFEYFTIHEINKPTLDHLHEKGFVLADMKPGKGGFVYTFNNPLQKKEVFKGTLF